MKIGFIGLGNVGGKLAESLLRNKFDIIVRDLDSNITKKFSEQGAQVANRPKDLAKKAGFEVSEAIGEDCATTTKTPCCG